MTKNLTAEQQRLLLIMGQHKGKCPMTTINGLFHGRTINSLIKQGLLEVPLFGGWYLTPERDTKEDK